MSDAPQIPLVPAAMQHALVVAHAEAARLRARIAELEGRVVKLPRFPTPWHRARGLPSGAATNMTLEEVRERLDAAGVNWEEE